jgi:hypothetical protein
MSRHLHKLGNAPNTKYTFTDDKEDKLLNLGRFGDMAHLELNKLKGEAYGFITAHLISENRMHKYPNYHLANHKFCYFLLQKIGN